MPANGAVETDSMLDTTAVCMIGDFETPANSGSTEASYTGPLWICKEVHWKLGRKPSFAMVEIPLASAVDETVPSVTLVDGPVKSIARGDYGRVLTMYSGFDVSKFAGTVVNVAQALKPDTALVYMEDHRYILEGFPIVGAFWISGTTAIKYRQGHGCRMNPKGQPNCTKGPNGEPVFCQPNWGLAQGESPGTTLTSGKACYWSVSLALDYFRRASISESAGGFATTDTDLFGFYSRLPDVIVWAAGVATACDSTGAGERKIKDKDWNGMKLNHILQDIAEMAGPYALYMRPMQSLFKNELMIVRTQYLSGGITIGRGTAGHASAVLNQNVISDGIFEEDIGELFTRVAIAGELVYIERRISTYTSTQLVTGWSSSDQTAALALMDAGIPAQSITGKTEDCFKAVFNQYKRVFAAYHIDEEFDPTASTTQSAFPRCNTPRVPLTTLLSNYLENASGTGSLDKLSDRVPVFFEVSADGSAWELCTEHDGFSVDREDGTIWLKGLRKSSGGAGTTINGSLLGAPLTCTPRYVRCTLAIPCDHQLVDWAKLKSESGNSAAPGAGVVDMADDAGKLSSHLSRLYYGDSEDLLQLAIKQASYPLPEKAGGSSETATLRDDTELLRAQVKRRLMDLGRVRRTGRLVFNHIEDGIHPGDMIQDITNVGTGGGYFVGACVHEVVHKCGGANHSELILG